MNTATVSMAVTPTVVSTFLSHYLNRKPLRERPTAHLSYDEGLHLIRSFLRFASHRSVEELQAFTAQWVPHPQWVKVENVEIPEDKIGEAASLLIEQLGPDGVRKVGGRKWWQWRRPHSPLNAEWIEMKADYHERKRSGAPCNRVMLYVHGGAYFFGSVGEHRYQMQRHARKLKARVFAPEYRLAPQFPFPCGLLDCLAAYLYLLTVQDASTIILAGDSAGGGMVLSMLVTLRDRGIPLPAGAILISPWVDLTHSFPSLSGDAPFDYIPSHGFHHKPSAAWPPLNADQYRLLKQQVDKQAELGRTRLMKPESVEMRRLSQNLGNLVEATAYHGEPVPSFLTIEIDGKQIQLKDQIQMYTTNELLDHPLVSPVMQPTLGGLPPLLIMTGGGEILRDEQLYLAHKCANPAKYAPRDELMHETAREQLSRFKPTDVQLQLWEDLCHVAPTLSFTHPAKFMYRSVAQFGAWALARAQKTEIEILDDDDISVISSSGESDFEARNTRAKKEKTGPGESGSAATVGKAGDTLPPFKNHMIRQRVDRHGIITPLEPETEIPACNLDANSIGVVKDGPVRKWLQARRDWDNRFGSASAKVYKRRLKEMVIGYEGFDGETPPPSALAGRRKTGEDMPEKRKKSMGLALWSLWGSKHDEQTVLREEQADKAPEVTTATEMDGQGARSQHDIQRQEEAVQRGDRSRSRHKIVRDESQIIHDKAEGVDENTPAAVLLERREERQSSERISDSLLSPTCQLPVTSVTGKRPRIGEHAVPFSLNKDARSANDDPDSHLSSAASPIPVAATTAPTIDEEAEPEPEPNAVKDDLATPRAGSPNPIAELEPEHLERSQTPKVDRSLLTTPTSELLDGPFDSERPPLEKFVTAEEDLPRVN